MLKIRRPLGRLIFNMGVAIPGKTVFLIETAPRPLASNEFYGIFVENNHKAGNGHLHICIYYGPTVQCVHKILFIIMLCFYIWHCVPNILLWSILYKTVGLPSSTGESERTARRQFHSPTLRCFRGRLCEVAAGRGPLKQSRWPESNWTLPLRSVGVAPSLGRFWLVFTALKLRYVLRRHIILSDSYGKQEVLNCFTVYPGLGGSAK